MFGRTGGLPPIWVLILHAMALCCPGGCGSAWAAQEAKTPSVLSVTKKENSRGRLARPPREHGRLGPMARKRGVDYRNLRHRAAAEKFHGGASPHCPEPHATKRCDRNCVAIRLRRYRGISDKKIIQRLGRGRLSCTRPQLIVAIPIRAIAIQCSPRGSKVRSQARRLASARSASDKFSCHFSFSLPLRASLLTVWTMSLGHTCPA